MWTNSLFGVSLFGTLKHGKPDCATLPPLSAVTPLIYPKPDGKITFDKPSSVFLSNTNHEEDQPKHLRLRDPAVPIRDNLPRIRRAGAALLPGRRLRGRLRRRGEAPDPRFVINAQNCVHCKTCDIKDPAQNIDWSRPKAAADPTTPICERRRAKARRAGAKPPRLPGKGCRPGFLAKVCRPSILL